MILEMIEDIEGGGDNNYASLKSRGWVSKLIQIVITVETIWMRKFVSVYSSKTRMNKQKCWLS